MGFYLHGLWMSEEVIGSPGSRVKDGGESPRVLRPRSSKEATSGLNS